MKEQRIRRQELTPEQVLAMLAEAPSRIAELTAGLRTVQLHTAPKPGDWSANDVLAHLRACADVGGDAIRTILAQNAPTLRAVNPRIWIRETDYLKKRFQPSLRAFAVQRAELLAVLQPLYPDAWLLSIHVTGTSMRPERSVLSYGRWLADHERIHLKQFERITKKVRG